MKRPLRIAHLFPELLNLYGDGGNVIVLTKRCQWRGIPVEVQVYGMGDRMNLADIDIVFIGGGTDREQKIVCDELLKSKAELQAFVEDDGALLAVCGGYQLLGYEYVMDEESVEGLALCDLKTVRGEGRLIGNASIKSSICDCPIIGFENHGGRTYLGEGATPLGDTLGATFGNNGSDGHEGVLYRNVVGTYLHGPLLPKNPQVADWLLAAALNRMGCDAEALLTPLDDAEELAANQVMHHRLGL